MQAAPPRHRLLHGTRWPLCSTPQVNRNKQRVYWVFLSFSVSLAPIPCYWPTQQADNIKQPLIFQRSPIDRFELKFSCSENKWFDLFLSTDSCIGRKSDWKYEIPRKNQSPIRARTRRSLSLLWLSSQYSAGTILSFFELFVQKPLQAAPAQNFNRGSQISSLYSHFSTVRFTRKMDSLAHSKHQMIAFQSWMEHRSILQIGSAVSVRTNVAATSASRSSYGNILPSELVLSLKPD